MIRGMVTGTFDIFTNGHASLIDRALAACDELIIGISTHPSKAPLFGIEERHAMISSTVYDSPIIRNPQKISKVKILPPDTFTVVHARNNGVDCIFRGVRNSTDYEYERQLNSANRDICPSVSTLFIPCDPQYEHISSSYVKSLIGISGWREVVKPLVSDCVYEQILDRFHKS